MAKNYIDLEKFWKYATRKPRRRASGDEIIITEDKFDKIPVEHDINTVVHCRDCVFRDTINCMMVEMNTDGSLEFQNDDDDFLQSWRKNVVKRRKE